jgi:Cu/Ag efflux protein CusF
MNEEEEAMKNLMGRFSMSVTLLGALFLAIAALSPRAEALDPCCTITAIDAKTSLVTAKDTATGQTFQFKVTDAAQLNSLKVGQGVYANFKTRQVSINGIGPCCAIVSLGKPGGLGNTAEGQNLGGQVHPAAPCCAITAIDAKSGVATAKVNATGQTFQFKVTDATLLNGLKVGQKVSADFAAGKVSVNGIGPCCSIVQPAVKDLPNPVR